MEQTEPYLITAMVQAAALADLALYAEIFLVMYGANLAVRFIAAAYKLAKKATW